MVCGRGPFDECRGVDVAEAHMRTPPPPLSTFVQNVPDELEHIVTSWLAKEPPRRPPSAALLAIKLREVEPPRYALRPRRRFAQRYGADADREHALRVRRLGRGSSAAEIATAPQAPEPKRITWLGVATTEPDAAPMGNARTALLDAPDPVEGEKNRTIAPRDLVDRAAPTRSMQEPVQRGARPRGETQEGPPPTPRVRPDLGDNVYLPVEEHQPLERLGPEMASARPLPAAGTPPPGVAQRHPQCS